MDEGRWCCECCHGVNWLRWIWQRSFLELVGVGLQAAVVVGLEVDVAVEGPAACSNSGWRREESAACSVDLQYYNWTAGAVDTAAAGRAYDGIDAASETDERSWEPGLVLPWLHVTVEHKIAKRLELDTAHNSAAVAAGHIAAVGACWRQKGEAAAAPFPAEEDGSEAWCWWVLPCLLS